MRQVGAPDLVLAGIGAWWSTKDWYKVLERDYPGEWRGSREAQFGAAVRLMMSALQGATSEHLRPKDNSPAAIVAASDNATRPSEYLRVAWRRPLLVWLSPVDAPPQRHARPPARPVHPVPTARR